MRTLPDLARRLGKGKYWDSDSLIEGCASPVAKVKDSCEGIFFQLLDH